MFKKLALGTAQFGLDYGLSNTRGKIPRDEVISILDYARKNSLAFLDTASIYGDSGAVIGEYLKSRPGQFQVISKFASAEFVDEASIESQFRQSLETLKVNSLYGYLVHNFNNFLNLKKLWPTLEGLKQNGRVQKIGFSLYRPEELDQLLKTGLRFDILQIPFSVFDQRFKKYFAVLKERGVEIHARSVFLQGFYFLNPEELKGNLKAYRKALENLQHMAQRRGVPLHALCLGFCLLQEEIGRVIIGVAGLGDLQKNFSVIENIGRVKDVFSTLETLKIDDENLLLPYKWDTKESLMARGTEGVCR